MLSKTKTLANETKSGGQVDGRAGVETSRHLLRLYVTGTTAGSTRAIQQVRKVCEERLHGRYDLEVIDIYRLPALAKHDQIIATPTLIKVLPAPLRRLIGDLSDVNRVLFGMDIREPC
jgi:circadian clock protein KaiB